MLAAQNQTALTKNYKVDITQEKESRNCLTCSDRDRTVMHVTSECENLTQGEFKKVNGFVFPLLSDHDATVAAAYGAKYNNDFTNMKFDRIAKRSAFVVDKDGKVAYAEVLENAGEIPNLDAVKSALND